jgi:glutathione synthase
VLKPNLEGGGNNIYGEEVKIQLKRMDSEERKKYILMEKITTKPVQNILMNGLQNIKVNCIYEVSQYGIIAIDNNQLVKSDSCGFLIRIKPEDVNEGGIMAGVGSICSWIIEDV